MLGMGCDGARHICRFAPYSHFTSAVESADSEAAKHKTAKYVTIAGMHHIVSVAIETSAVF